MPTPKLARLTLDHLEARDVPAAFVVAPTGLDTNPGTAAQPFATLQAAANKVHAGDTVTVEPGTYAGFNLTTSGTATARIVFQADPTAAAGSVVVNRPNPWNHIDGINLEGASYATIDGFKVINQPRAGIRAVTDQFVTIKNNIADANTTWGIFTGFSDDLLIQNNQASNTKQQHGIYVSNSGDRPVVRGNYVFGNNDSGIQLNADLSSGGDGTISNALIENNLIVGNGAGGGGSINLDGVVNSVVRNNRIDQAKAAGITLFHQDGATGSYGNAIVNNTVIVDYVGSVSRGRDALAISGGSTGATVLNNILFTTNPNARALSVAADSQTGLVSDYNALPANSIAAGRDAHSIGLADGAALNALFVNRAGGDLHLKPGSAAVDAGTTTSAPASDFEGTPRPSGPRVDIGADEVYVAVAPRRRTDDIANRQPDNRV